MCDGSRPGHPPDGPTVLCGEVSQSPIRERRLQDVSGWTWDPYADRWEEGFSQLQRYLERHGDARVPQSYTVDDYKLGHWVNKQRSNYAKRP